MVRLRHRVAYGMMVSDTNMVSKEGWSLVDKMGTDSCDASTVDHHRSGLPPVVHYCQVRFLCVCLSALSVMKKKGAAHIFTHR